MKKTAAQKAALARQSPKDGTIRAEKARPARSAEQRQVEAELNLYRDQLEDLVSERTLALELANSQLEAEIDEHRQSEILQSALFQISEKASQAEDMDALYAAIHGIISSLLYARNFYIALIDPAGRMLSFPYFVDEFDAAARSPRNWAGA